MANTKKFAVKNGLTTPNIGFLSPDETKTITATMLNSSSLSFTGTTGQLFSVTDSMTGTIFAVNDISGVPSIEVDDTGTIRFAEFTGNVLIGTAVDDGINKLQVNGIVKATTISLSGGTANGVAYLNASKVFTTGTALVFDGTNFSTTGTASATKLIPTGGTATGNGMYLPTANQLAWSNNGSETMRLTSTGLGIGTNSINFKVDSSLGSVNGNTTNYGYNIFADAATNVGYSGYSLQLNNSTANATGFIRLARTSSTLFLGMEIQSQSRDGIRFLTNATTPVEVVRIDAAGNVGIGNTSPFYKLQINNATTVGTAASVLSNSTPILYLDNGSAANGSIVIKSHSVGNGNVHGAVKFASSPDSTNYSWAGVAGVADANSAASNLVFYTATGNAQATAAGASTERMRLDINGNLGLGVSPSAWGAAVKAIDISTAGAIISSSNAFEMYLNSYWNGTSFIYKTTAVASKYEQSLGRHVWWNAASGTAGAAISFTQAMTLDASGNLGIGTISPSAPLSFGKAVYGDQNAENFYRIKFQDVGGVGNDTGIGQPAAGSMGFNIDATGTYQWFVGTNGERMRINNTSVTISATTASTSTTTGALVVSGGVGINGALNALTKSFVIPHPTKTGKLLKHGSLEGPEFGVYTRGRCTGNVIELPEYWTGLVDEETITVDLTPVGKHQKLYVEKIEGNRVYIANDAVFTSNINCFYTVWGARKDVGKLDVEVDE